MSDTEEKAAKSGKTYEERLKAVSPISKPLAGKKLTKKLYKLVKKASTSKYVRRGVKEVVKGLKRGDKGLCLIAGDIYPIDVISHLPVLCEEKDTPYIYVPSKHDLGSAAAVKRPTSCVLITIKGQFGDQELYDKLARRRRMAGSVKGEDGAPTSHERFGTVAIHAGQEPDERTGAVVPPISLATTFAQASPGVKYGLDDANSFGKGFEYSRTGNPTRGAFERAMAAVEHAKYGVAFASGLAATSALVHLLETGSHIVCVDDVYGGTQRYFRRIVEPTYNIKTTFVDFNDHAALKGAFRPETRMVWLETPTNPTLKISDMAATAEVCKARGVMFVVDNTFLSPYFQNPLDHGADVVVHSVTKYIGGHSDVVGGIVLTSDMTIYDKLRFVQNSVGAVPSPFDAYMALRGLKTLHVRLEAAAKNAMGIARFLESHSAVTKVLYPGLESHPQFHLAQRQQHGPGAMITFYVKGDISNARKLLENLKVFILAESLGAVESLAESPAIMTHASVPQEVRQQLGIDDTLIRLSVGIESEVDLISDLENALRAASS